MLGSPLQDPPPPAYLQQQSIPLSLPPPQAKATSCSTLEHSASSPKRP